MTSGKVVEKNLYVQFEKHVELSRTNSSHKKIEIIINFHFLGAPFTTKLEKKLKKLRKYPK